jgi:hypothetical protein
VILNLIPLVLEMATSNPISRHLASPDLQNQEITTIEVGSSLRAFLAQPHNSVSSWRTEYQKTVHNPPNRDSCRAALRQLANEASGRPGLASPCGRAGDHRQQASSKVILAGRAPDAP